MKTNLFILAIAVTLLSGCTETLDKKINKEDFEQVKETVNGDQNYSAMKKRYIIDNLSMQLGFAELGKAMKMDESKLPTFREQITELSTDFDSVRTAKLEIRENNKKLQEFVELVDVNTISIDKYNGYLTMKVDFNNQFDKKILYIILNYKYVNNYDTEFFNENSKLTDEVAKDFKGEVELSTKEEYNRVASFMYSEVPIRARKALQDELGEKGANEKVKKDFLMEGFKVEATGIVFKDKSELTYQNANWEYLED